MNPFATQLGALVPNLELAAPRIPMISTLTGKPVAADGQELNTRYWQAQIREAVQFAPAVDHLITEGFRVFIEVGPQRVLGGFVIDVAKRGDRPVTVLSSMRRQTSARETLYESLGGLFACGYPLDLRKLEALRGNFVALPNYPWQHTPYWIPRAEPAAAEAPSVAAAALRREAPANAAAPDDWLYTKAYVPAPLAATPARTGGAPYLILAAAEQRAEIVAEMQRRGQPCVVATPGDGFASTGTGQLQHRPNPRCGLHQAAGAHCGRHTLCCGGAACGPPPQPISRTRRAWRRRKLWARTPPSY